MLRAVCFDLGDTIMIEETQVKSEEGITLRAELFCGMADLLRQLKASGFKLGLIADTRSSTYHNVLRQHKLEEVFNVVAISEELGTEKPDPRMFVYALDRLNVSPGEAVMCGNNLARDIAGANQVGMVSIWVHRNYRYPTIPLNDLERPQYTVHSAEELLTLINTLSGRR
ncbi:MAG: HAD family hydrolase [Bacillota bacterium]